MRLDGCAFGRPFPDIGDEAESLAGDGLDQALLLAIVPDHLARGVDVAGEGRFGDDARTPDLLQQIVLADDPVAAHNEIGEEIENLRANRDRLGLPQQFPAVEIKHKVGEQELHFGAPTSCVASRAKRPIERSSAAAAIGGKLDVETREIQDKFRRNPSAPQSLPRSWRAISGCSTAMGRGRLSHGEQS
jgi:hypothetical protein